MSQPNILLLMMDQLRWDALGCTGDWVQTPNLDRIASEGIRFSNCVANSPVCIPTRLSLATGLYPHNTAVWNNQNYTLDPEHPTWMQSVRKAGYRTSLFGKTHLHPHSGDLREREHLLHAYGLDDVDEIGGPRASARVLSHMTAQWQRRGKWQAYQEDYEERFATKPHLVRPSVLGLEDYADRYVGERSRQYLEDYEGEAPWFCWVSFGGPHEPWDAPEPYASMYAREVMPDPIQAPADWSVCDARPRGVVDERMATRPDLTMADIAAMRANYAGNVTLIDDEIGGIVEAVEARGEWENTVVVLASDHGEMNGDFGLLYKSNLLNSAARVPLLVRVPGMAAGGQAGALCTHPTEWMDIGPTLAELAGGELAHRQFGRSLCPVLEEPSAGHREEALSEIDGEVMMLTEEWKLVVNAEGRAYLLFNVVEDPEERRNLAGSSEMRDVEDELRLRLLERLIRAQVRAL